MDSVWRQLGFDVPDDLEFARVAIKLVLAAGGDRTATPSHRMAIRDRRAMSLATSRPRRDVSISLGSPDV